MVLGETTVKLIGNITLRTAIIALASYSLAVLFRIDAMARTAWRGSYGTYILVFLVVSTVALAASLLAENRIRFIGNPVVGFCLRVALCCIASWAALIVLSYRMASIQNRASLEFMSVGAHTAIGIYLSGAVFYGLCLATMALCVSRMARGEVS